MTARSAFFRLLFLSVAIGATVAGCGAPNGTRSSLLPNTAGLAAPGGTVTDGEAGLDQAVARSHRDIAGTTPYGVIDGEWVEPPPAPGRPGYYIVEGEVVAGPPDDTAPLPEPVTQPVTAVSPAPAGTLNCKTFTGTVPPPCTATGPFRRVYSAPDYSYALANVTFPAPILTMPSNPPYHGDTGFVYMEGWLSSAPNAGNSEFGFQYSADNHWYSLYARTNNPVGYFIFELNKKPIHYLSSQTVTFAMAGYIIGNADYLHMSALGTADILCTLPGSTKQTHTCLSHGHVPDNGWVPSRCCIMARMTSIGQSNPLGLNWFYDGVKFGPIAWSGAELAQTAPTPAPSSTILSFAKEPAWTAAGVQNWPSLQNKIVARYTSSAAETDTVDLAELPAAQVSLNPSGCQYYPKKTSVTVDYSANVSGKAGSVPIEYGWFPGTKSLTVPGATLNPSFGLWVGNGTSATWKGGLGGGIGAALFTVSVQLLYVDATGNLSSYWYAPGTTYSHIKASDGIALGAVNLCPTPPP